MSKNILVTGGAGYIGSHTVLELLNADYEVIVLDNLSNSNIESLNRVEKITGKKIKFYKVDLLDPESTEKVFTENNISDVIHFAALKAVGESVEIPLQYYENNLVGTINLLKIMQKHKVKNFVFSSSATVYGDPEKVPINEDAPLTATNPYGWTKLMIEQILTDKYISDKKWNIGILRYFNPVGAHKSGMIGEDPQGIPNNLMPYISQVAIGKRDELNIFGNDYNTIDGTGVRDYIHVVDLALGHLATLKKLEESIGLEVYNLGTGNGYSVLQLVMAYEKASGKTVKYKFVNRRAGDIAECFADPTKAVKELNWRAEKGLDEMCADSWKWQSENPDGY
ncbi:MAG: UDP-glucose 4-epimerase GalE [Melioribacteraceae bacterium]|nr:UDP-glucose 4-epimerase GalE [Melioribacteraceae bacterium]